MGYCGGINWISDYNYQKALNYRQNNSGTVVAGAQAGLLVWGRIVNGVVQLEPAFEISAPVQRAGAPRSVRARGPRRSRLRFSSATRSKGSWWPTRMVGQRQFAFVIPLGAVGRDRLARLRVRGGSRDAELASAAAMRGAGRGASAMLRQQQPLPDRQARVVGSAVGAADVERGGLSDGAGPRRGDRRHPLLRTDAATQRIGVRGARRSTSRSPMVYGAAGSGSRRSSALDRDAVNPPGPLQTAAVPG